MTIFIYPLRGHHRTAVGVYSQSFIGIDASRGIIERLNLKMHTHSMYIFHCNKHERERDAVIIIKRDPFHNHQSGVLYRMMHRALAPISLIHRVAFPPYLQYCSRDTQSFYTAQRRLYRKLASVYIIQAAI